MLNIIQENAFNILFILILIDFITILFFGVIMKKEYTNTEKILYLYEKFIKIQGISFLLILIYQLRFLMKGIEGLMMYFNNTISMSDIILKIMLSFLSCFCLMFSQILKQNNFSKNNNEKE